ncbi:MAG: CBS domain-containing protein [Motiliproteus sp.]
MNEVFKKLNNISLPENTPVYQSGSTTEDKIKPTDPAISVMTDLKIVKAITVSPQLAIDDALQRMISAEVRMLLVVDNHTMLVGVITSRDVMGEKPVVYASQERLSRDQILVANIMTPREQIEALTFEDVCNAQVGDIVTTLRDSSRQHALVMESDSNGGGRVCGLFSITHIGRLLGIKIQPTGIVQSFAELESILVRD